jgi:hypothetical protein
LSITKLTVRPCRSIHYIDVTSGLDKSDKTFFKLSQSLWTLGSTIPSPGSHIVRLPFRFALPEDLAPSFVENGPGDRKSLATSLSAHVSYNLIVKGERKGLLKRDRKVVQAIHISKAAGQGDVRNKALLTNAPWPGAWHTFTEQAILSTGGLARAELTLPELEHYPLDTPIPYRLRIVTQSAACAQTVDLAFSELLPELPTQSAHIKLFLSRKLCVKAGYVGRASSQFLLPIGGFGASRRSDVPIRRRFSVPIYVSSAQTGFAAGLLPTSGYHGAWQHASHFEGLLTLSGAPSFNIAQDIVVSYQFKLEALIPGTGMTLCATWDILVSSGVEAPPPSFDFSCTDASSNTSSTSSTSTGTSQAALWTR